MQHICPFCKAQIPVSSVCPSCRKQILWSVDQKTGNVLIKETLKRDSISHATLEREGKPTMNMPSNDTNFSCEPMLCITTDESDFNKTLIEHGTSASQELEMSCEEENSTTQKLDMSSGEENSTTQKLDMSSGEENSTTQKLDMSSDYENSHMTLEGMEKFLPPEVEKPEPILPIDGIVTADETDLERIEIAGQETLADKNMATMAEHTTSIAGQEKFLIPSESSVNRSAIKTQSTPIPSTRSASILPKSTPKTQVKPCAQEIAQSTAVQAIQATVALPQKPNRVSADEQQDISDTQEKNSGFSSGEVLKDTYRIDNLLGQGGMGKVYRATHIRLNKQVVVKTLLNNMVENVRTLKRFEREALLQAQVDHPNVVNIIDLDRTEDGTIYMVMDFVDGIPLNKIIEEKLVTLPKMIDLAIQITDVIAYAHEKGIIHRDLKPQNIMVENKGGKHIVKILDFGIAKMISSETPSKIEGNLTMPHMIVGSLYYMAPEQAGGEQVDFKADIYSLGVIFYEMLSGELPLKHKESLKFMTMLFTQNPPMLSELDLKMNMPPNLEKLVMMCLAKDPQKRPANARVVLQELEKIQSSSVDITSQKMSFSKKVMLWMGIAAMFIACVGMGIWSWSNIKQKEHTSSLDTVTVSAPSKTPNTTEQPKASITKVLMPDKPTDHGTQAAPVMPDNLPTDHGTQVPLHSDSAQRQETQRQETQRQETQRQETQRQEPPDKNKILALRSLESGNMLLSQDKDDEALRQYQLALNYDNTLDEIHLGMGEIFFKRQDWKQSLFHLEEATKLDAQNFQALHLTGCIYMHQGNFAKAQEYFERVVDINPRYAEAYNGLGVVYIQKQDYDKALQYMNKAEELSPEWEEAKKNLIAVLTKLNRPKDALAVYEKWRKQNPTNPDLPYEMGILYLKNLKDPANAIKVFRTYLELEKRPEKQEQIEKTKELVKKIEILQKKRPLKHLIEKRREKE